MKEEAARESGTREALPVEPHDLFLQRDEDDPIIGTPELAHISVQRVLPFRENAGRSFTPDEIPNPEALKARFGGGTYHVLARDVRKQVIRGGKREYTFEGTSRPMTASTEAAAAAAPPAPTSPAPAGVEARLAAMERNFERLIDLVGSVAKNAAPPATPALSTEAIIAIMDKSQERALTLAKELLSARSEQSTGAEVLSTFLQGHSLATSQFEGQLEAMQERAQAGDGDGVADILKTVTAAVEGMKSIRGMKKPNGAPAPTNGNGAG